MTNSNALSFHTMSRLWEDSRSPHAQNIHILIHIHTPTHTSSSVISHQIYSYMSYSSESQFPDPIHSGTWWAKSTYGEPSAHPSTVSLRSSESVEKMCRRPSPLTVVSKNYSGHVPSRGRLVFSHCSIMSLRFSCRMVSLTAWKTKRMFSVSMAVVKWWNSGLLRLRRLRLKHCTR